MRKYTFINLVYNKAKIIIEAASFESAYLELIKITKHPSDFKAVMNEVKEDEDEDDADYSDKKKVCSECYSENIRMAMIPDAVGNGLHEGWVCDDCKQEEFEPDLVD